MTSSKNRWIWIGALSLVALAPLAYAKGKAMERVNGIGGFFFKARDPQGLGKWYETHLGVTMTPTSYDESPWWQKQGPTVFAGFPQDTTYFGPPAKQWMINFRVRNLDAMVRQLRADAIQVDVDKVKYPNGRFARLVDPEGNAIQLWEPMGRQTPH